jgi:hypothetical protein
MLSRRKFLGLSIALGGVAAHTLVWGRTANGETDAGVASLTQGLWVYHPVEPITAARLAYEGHSKNGCSYGVFYGILSQLAEGYGEPYRSFPFKMMEFGTENRVMHIAEVLLCLCAIGLFLRKDKVNVITTLLQWMKK